MPQELVVHALKTVQPKSSSSHENMNILRGMVFNSTDKNESNILLKTPEFWIRAQDLNIFLYDKDDVEYIRSG